MSIEILHDDDDTRAVILAGTVILGGVFTTTENYSATDRAKQFATWLGQPLFGMLDEAEIMARHTRWDTLGEPHSCRGGCESCDVYGDACCCESSDCHESHLAEEREEARYRAGEDKMDSIRSGD